MSSRPNPAPASGPASGPTSGPAPASASRMPRVVVLAAVVAVLAIAAAVIAFADGNWLLGIPFVLLAAVDGNIAWFYLHRARRAASAAEGSAGTAA